MIDSYLEDRTLLYDTLYSKRRLTVTSSAAQGSISFQISFAQKNKVVGAFVQLK